MPRIQIVSSKASKFYCLSRIDSAWSPLKVAEISGVPWVSGAQSKNFLGGHSNISVIHMCDQRFSKHTLKAVFPLQEKHPINENFAQFGHQIYPKQAFLRKTCLVEFEKLPLNVAHRRSLLYIAQIPLGHVIKIYEAICIMSLLCYFSPTFCTMKAMIYFIILTDIQTIYHV